VRLRKSPFDLLEVLEIVIALPPSTNHAAAIRKGENHWIKTQKNPKRAHPHPLTCIRGFMTRN